MTAKEYLGQIQTIDIKVGQRITEVNQMREKITLLSGIDYSKDRVQSTPTSGNKQIETLVDLENKVRNMIVEEAKIKNKIIDEIQSLDNPVYVDILFRKYVELKTLEQIAFELKYTYNYVCAQHGDALLDFDLKVLNKS